MGSFVNTPGDQILFFPGLMFSRIIHTPKGRDLLDKELHNLDHFSLVKENLTDWHITLLQKRTQGIRYPTQKTKRVNDNVFLWFLLAIRDAGKLEPMPKTHEYRLKGPNTDIKRRLKSIVQSVECSEFPVTLVNYHPPSPNFLN